jgi:tRNA(fMet)-specific endonuclease VapC
MFLLDSDIATLALHGHPRVAVRLAAADRPVRVPLATYLESYRGRIEAVLKAATPEELLRAADSFARTVQFLGGFDVVGIDAAVAAEFQTLRAGKKTKNMGRGDLLNACIALANGATLVTRNTKDYVNVPGLKLENWAD